MKKKTVICLVLVVMVMLIVNVLPVYAARHGHGHSSFRGSVWIGPGWGGWGPWWWGSPAYPYYYPYYYSGPPVIMQENPSEYVQQPVPHTDEENYWYFCPDSRNYYPYVKTCPSGWLKVVPPQAPPDWKE
jgi:hypothetical protein